MGNENTDTMIINTAKRTFTKDKLTVNAYPTTIEMGEDAAAQAAAVIKDLLSKKETINMIFAAAPSQNEFLEALVATPGIDWSRVNAFHMDEYIGLPSDAPQGFGNFLDRAIFGKLPFRTVNYINGGAEDIAAECERYSKLLRENPVDVVCLGIGENGHIAFNDPWVADFHDPQLVKSVPLDEVCRQQQVNDGCFATIDDVPTHALSLTIPALCAGEWMFCVVPHTTKANAVRTTIEGEISEKCPASILRTKEHAYLYIDADSASLLSE